MYFNNSLFQYISKGKIEYFKSYNVKFIFQFYLSTKYESSYIANENTEAMVATKKVRKNMK